MRYCSIFIKSSESLTDPLLVQYQNGQKRRVNGDFLFLSKKSVFDWLEKQKTNELNELETKMNLIQDQITKVELLYNTVQFEEPKQAEGML